MTRIRFLNSHVFRTGPHSCLPFLSFSHPSLSFSLSLAVSLPIFLSHPLYLSFSIFLSLFPAPVPLSIVLSPTTASLSFFLHSYLSFYLPLSVTPSVSFSLSLPSQSSFLSPTHGSLPICFSPALSFFLSFLSPFLSHSCLSLSLLALSLSFSRPYLFSISLEPGLFLSFSLSNPSLLFFLPLMALFQSASLPPWT